MANHKSALKRIRRNEAVRLRNRYQHKTVRNAIKKLRNEEDKKAAEALLPTVVGMIDKLAKKTPGKRALAVEAFARALRQIPAIIADNAGLDSADLVSRLVSTHANHDETNGKCYAGVDVVLGDIGDMKQIGIRESLRVKRQVLLSAEEAAEMIVRVDNVLSAAPRRRE